MIRGSCLLLKSMPKKGVILSDECLKAMAEKYKGKSFVLEHNAGRISNLRFENSAIHCDYELIFTFNVSLKPLQSLTLPEGNKVLEGLIEKIRLVAPLKL